MPLLRVNARVPLVWQATMRVPVVLDDGPAADEALDVDALGMVDMVFIDALDAIDMVDIAGFGA